MGSKILKGVKFRQFLYPCKSILFLVIFVLVLMIRQPAEEQVKEYKIASESSQKHKWQINDTPQYRS